jgi:hypothetical protein
MAVNRQMLLYSLAMQTRPDTQRYGLRQGDRLWRWLLALCAIVFALQVLASSSHSHDLADKLDDCVACQMASHFPADVPSTPPALLAIFLAVAYFLARQPSAPAAIAPQRYLIPQRQAPPRIAS